MDQTTTAGYSATDDDLKLLAGKIKSGEATEIDIGRFIERCRRVAHTETAGIGNAGEVSDRRLGQLVAQALGGPKVRMKRPDASNLTVSSGLSVQDSAMSFTAGGNGELKLRGTFSARPAGVDDTNE